MSGKFSWGADYGKDILVDLNQMAHASGTGPLTRDLLQRAYVEIVRLRDAGLPTADDVRGILRTNGHN